MCELVKVHTYYIYSLNAFVVVFTSGIDTVHKKDAEDKEKAEAKPKKFGGGAGALKFHASI